MATIRRIFDGGARFDTGQIQRTDVGDVIGGVAAGIGRQCNAGRGGRRIEREVERRRIRRIACDIGLPDLYVIRAFDGVEAGAPGMTAIDRVFDGGA
ncbi:hypothetical protein, partial [Burkholderia ambifaria]|uniref:hypothetical protein n=1 Tax=Burkholderia ambifaria TaxID=152480 RepID=UPI001FC8DC15